MQVYDAGNPANVAPHHARGGSKIAMPEPNVRSHCFVLFTPHMLGNELGCDKHDTSYYLQPSKVLDHSQLVCSKLCCVICLTIGLFHSICTACTYYISTHHPPSQEVTQAATARRVKNLREDTNIRPAKHVTHAMAERGTRRLQDVLSYN